MLKINPDDKRRLKFEVNIQGIDYQKLKGALRFNVNEIEYGFPVEVSEGSIVVDIPPLGNVIKNLMDNQEIDANLQVFGEGFFLQPWIGKFEVDIPVKVEATIMDDNDSELINESKKAKVQVKSIEEDKEVLHEPVEDEDNIQSIKVIKKESKNPIKKVIKKKKKLKESEMTELYEDLISKKVNSKLNKIRRNISESMKTNKTSSKKIVKKKIIKKSPLIKPKVITQESLHQLLESVGIKNKRVQNSLIENAEMKSDGDIEVVYENLKKMTYRKPISEMDDNFRAMVKYQEMKDKESKR